MSPRISTKIFMEKPLSFREPKLPEGVDLQMDLTLEEFFRHRLAAQFEVDPSEVTSDFLTRIEDLLEGPFIGSLHSPDGHNHPVTPEQEEKIARFVRAHPLKGFIGIGDGLIKRETGPISFIRPWSCRLFDDDHRYVRELIDRTNL